MLPRILILFLGACATLAAETGRVNLDARVLTQIPARRHAALILFAITDRDSTPAISEKKTKYVEALKALILDLRSEYYWHAEFPKDIDEAIEKRAVDLAGLRYPASPTTGASAYGVLVQNYAIRMYEEELVAIADAVSRRFFDQDIAIVRGEAQPFAAWKKAWDKAGEVKGGPNQAPGAEP